MVASVVLLVEMVVWQVPGGLRPVGGLVRSARPLVARSAVRRHGASMVQSEVWLRTLVRRVLRVRQTGHGVVGFSAGSVSDRVGVRPVTRWCRSLRGPVGGSVGVAIAVGGRVDGPVRGPPGSLVDGLIGHPLGGLLQGRRRF